MYNWRVTYKDGSSLPQFNDDKTENSYISIKREKIDKFTFLNDGKEIFTLVLERPTQKLIYRKRTFYRPFASVESQYVIVFMIGWHENINGKSIKSICYIYEDGHIEMAGAKDDCELISCEL